MKKHLFGVYLVALAFLIPTSNAYAVGSGGFENASFSAKSLAQSNAVVAQADEPAAISYNPAGIVDLQGVQIQTNLTGINIFTHIRHAQGNTKSEGTTSLVPTGYITINPGELLGNRIAFGIGSDSPFGLANAYDSIHPSVRYTGAVNWLKMYTIKPTIAVRVTDWLSIGGGPMYYDVFSFVGRHEYPNVLLGLAASDGGVRADLAGNAWGWQMGALAKIKEKHRLGFYFRSPVNMLTKGHIDVTGSAVSGGFRTGAHAELNFPLNFTFAYAYKPTKKTTLEADFGFTRWGINDKIYIFTDPVNASDDTILAAIGHGTGNDRDYENGFSIHLGGNHDLNEKWNLRFGGLFYSRVVPNQHFRPSVADSNSVALSLGVGYKVTKDLTVDLSYFGRLWLPRDVDNDISESLGGSVDGRYISYGNVVTVSVTTQWEGIFDRFVEGAGSQDADFSATQIMTA